MLEKDPEVMEAFAEEASDRLSTLEASLLDLERAPDAPQDGLLDAVFRDAHSIKAGANLLRLERVEAAAHGLENVLDSLRKGQLTPRKDVTQALLDGVDLLRDLLETPEAKAPASMPRRLAVLEALLKRTPGSA